jgi:hypothetical protein
MSTFRGLFASDGSGVSFAGVSGISSGGKHFGQKAVGGCVHSHVARGASADACGSFLALKKRLFAEK